MERRGASLRQKEEDTRHSRVVKLSIGIPYQRNRINIQGDALCHEF